MPVDSEVELELSVREHILSLRGTVIYTKKMFGDFMTLLPGMAIEFDELTDQDAQVLKRYIEDILAGDIMEDQEEPMIERKEGTWIPFRYVRIYILRISGIS